MIVQTLLRLRGLAWRATIVIASISCAHSATYYVSTSGSDGNPGSFESPWRTVQKAASTMVAGDTAYIRGGTYRETVVPVNSGTPSDPITFEAYGNESVVISGFDVVTAGWTQYNGDIYSAPVTLSQGDQNQVFIDGNTMATLARWPNDTDGDLFTHDGAVVTSGNTGSITSTALPVQPADYYKGGIVWYSARLKWTCMGWSITSSSNNTINFTNGATSSFAGAMNPGTKAGTDLNYFYVSGLLGLLDAEREWYYDSTLAKLYLWVPGGGSPASHMVEVKARSVAFDLSQSYIHLNKLRIKGAKVMISGSNNTLDGIIGTYMWHHDARGMSWSYVVPLLWPYTGAFYITGINNTIKNSEFSYSAGSMIVLGGGSDNTTIDNNYIHHVDYNGSYDAGIIADATLGSATITRNTMHTTGRSHIHIGGPVLTKPWKVKWNDFSNPMVYTDDGASFYTNGSNLMGTVFAYNHFHGQVTVQGNRYSPGIYVDDKSQNVTVHHCVIYDVATAQSAAIKVGGGTTGKNLYNITTYDVPSTFVANHSGGSAVVVNSLHLAAAANFTDAAGHDFRPVASASGVIDKGVVAPPFTDGFAGSAPDLGAYEYGGPARLANWTVGVGSTIYPDIEEPLPPPLPVNIVNDSVTGTGPNQFEYVGDWGVGKVSGCLLDDEHGSSTTGSDYALFRFIGGRIQLYGWRYTSGSGAISIDGGPETTVSYKGSGNYDAAMVFDSGNLTVGPHILKVRNLTGGTTIDFAEVSPFNDTIVDTPAAVLTGTWSTIVHPTRPGFFGDNYKTDGAAGKGTKTARFTPNLPAAGDYEVYGRWVADPNKSPNAAYTITYAGNVANLSIDQRDNGGQWVLLGIYPFNAGTAGNVLISNTGTAGTVVADAVRFVPVAQKAPSRPRVSVTAADTAAEPGPTAGTFTISRTNSVGDLTVRFGVGGTADAGVDYTISPSSESIVIPDGKTSVTVTVTPVQDTLPEDGETVQLSIVADPAYLVTTGWATLAIRDDDVVMASRIIGSATSVGRFGVANGQFTVAASGAGVSGNADNFRFAYQPLVGDGSITARLVSFECANVFARTGVMIRESLDPGSIEVSSQISVGQGARYSRRTTTNGAEIGTSPSDIKAPYWLRVTRAGNTITALRSANGADWVTLTPAATFSSLPPKVYVGFAVSGGGTSLGTAVYDGVSVVGDSGLAKVSVQAADATASEAGSDGGKFTISRTGSTTSPLLVSYRLDGTAVNGVDYQSLGGVATIGAGATSADVTVTPVPDATIEGAETVALVLTSDLSTYTIDAPDQATVTIAEPPIDAWRLDQFGGNASNPAVAGDDGDPDHDGVSNLMEYALGLNPNAASPRDVPVAKIEDVNSVTCLTLTYPKTRAEINYAVDGSQDFQAWSVVPDQSIGFQGGVELRRAAVPKDLAHRFLRLRIER